MFYYSHIFSFDWNDNESIIENVERIKDALFDKRRNLLEAEKSIPVLKEKIKRHKQRIEEVKELIKFYTKSCDQLENARPGLRNYRKGEKAIFLKNKAKYLKDKDWIQQQIINQRITDFLRESQSRDICFYSDWLAKQIEEFDEKQGEIYKYINLENEFSDKDFIEEVYHIAKEIQQNEEEFMAPRIEQALRRYRAIHG